MLKVVVKHQNLKNSAVASGIIGYVLNMIGKNQEALDWHLKSCEITKSLKDSMALAVCYNNLGTVTDSMGKYEEAVDWYLKSIEINKILNDNVELAECYNYLDYVYSSSNREEESISFYNLGLKILEDSTDINIKGYFIRENGRELRENE